MKGTFEFKLKNGSTCRIEAEYECIMHNEILDADGIKVIGEIKPKRQGEMIAYVDNKKVDSCTDSAFWRLIDAQPGIKKIWGLKIAFAKPEDAARYTEWINGIIEGGKSEAVKAYEQAQKDKEQAQKIERAKEIIRKAESQNDIPDAAEAKRRMKQYNDIVNESGEGYIPHIISKQEYDYALKIIEEAAGQK